MSSRDIVVLEEIWICPPMAFSRFGKSATPVENFRYKESNYQPRGTAETQVIPELTFEIGADGGICRAYIPDSIVLRDPVAVGEPLDSDRKWRPVCPFFELHGRLSDGYEGVLTTTHLEQLGITLSDIQWQISTANRKAYHYTLNDGDWIVAQVDASGDNHDKQALDGVSKQPSATALLAADTTIPMGFAQVIKPTNDHPELRMRITPPVGLIYGPTNTADRDLSALVPPNQSDSAFLEGIEQILNPASPWAHWSPTLPDGTQDPRTNPGGLYAQEPNEVSLGFVDDSSDGLIQITVSGDCGITPGDMTAYARFTCCPQDFQPDRRPFVSIADGLSDLVNREEVLDPAYIEGDNWAVTEAEIADLMQRVKETMEASNVDQQNLRSKMENDEWGVAIGPDDFPFTPQAAQVRQPLPLTQSGRDHHNRFLAYEVFKQFAAQQHKTFEDIVRDPTANPAPYDSKMPAVMKGSDATPMTLSQRQYILLMSWLDEVRSGIEQGDNNGR